MLLTLITLTLTLTGLFLVALLSSAGVAFVLALVVLGLSVMVLMSFAAIRWLWRVSRRALRAITTSLRSGKSL